MARPYGVLKHPALAWQTDREAAILLDKMSKAALIDCICDLMKFVGSDSCDAPISEERLKNRLEPVLISRNDRWP
jgi:hypothetical protein